jgi:hypothetical protein
MVWNEQSPNSASIPRIGRISGSTSLAQSLESEAVREIREVFGNL